MRDLHHATRLTPLSTSLAAFAIFFPQNFSISSWLTVVSDLQDEEEEEEDEMMPGHMKDSEVRCLVTWRACEASWFLKFTVLFILGAQ